MGSVLFLEPQYDRSIGVSSPSRITVNLLLEWAQSLHDTSIPMSFKATMFGFFIVPDPDKVDG